MIGLNVFPLFRIFLPPPLPPLHAPATRAIFNMFPTDFRFRNNVFLQSLTFVYVAETYYFVLLRAET